MGGLCYNETVAVFMLAAVLFYSPIYQCNGIPNFITQVGQGKSLFVGIMDIISHRLS